MSRIPPSGRDPNGALWRALPAIRQLVPGKIQTVVAAPLPRALPSRQTTSSSTTSGVGVEASHDRFPTSGTFASTPATVSLSSTPLPFSLHLYKNRDTILDEGSDYTLSLSVVTFLGGSVATGDFVNARYLNGGATPVFVDDFNRANSSLTIPWVQVGSDPLLVISNEVGFAGGGSGHQGSAVVDLGDTDFDVQVQIGVTPNADDMGMVYRHDGSSVAFSPACGTVAYDHSAQVIHYRPDGTNAIVATAGPGDVLRAIGIGTSVTVYKNGVAVDGTTQPAPSGGQTWAGLYAEFSNTAGRLDNFIAGTP